MRTILIVGNSDGIGATLAAALLARGDRVVGISRSPAPIAHPHLRHVVADVAAPDYPALLAQLIAVAGPVDACVYCAGVGSLLTLPDFSKEAAVVDINLTGMVRTMAALVPHWLERRAGHFVGLSSLADVIDNADAPSYSASKAGFSRYLRAMARTLSRTGVSVTNVRFGFVDTKMAKAVRRPMMMTRDQAAAHIMRCLATRPVQLSVPRTAAAAVWLVSGLQRLRWLAVAAALGIAVGVNGAVPSSVDITWMSIANVHFAIGPLKILADGYITRIPQTAFSGGGSGLAHTDRAFRPDLQGIRRVMQAIGGPSSVNVLLTGHSHFDHSFDTATWSRLTGARIIGSRTTCFQASAERLPENRCTPVDGGEIITLAEGVTLHVVRWNHSGDPSTNPEQHNAVELRAPPVADPVSGGLKAGVADDFPNGGGGRAFLFTVDAPEGRLSWFFQDSASPVDLHAPVVVDGRNHGAPLDNLKAALKEAGLTSVDLWIGTGGRAIAQLVLPVLHPKAYLPVHWDGLYGPFEAGVPRPYRDDDLAALLAASGVRLVTPLQYMDKWRLDRRGITAVSNARAKQELKIP